jgi:hypothetical protein
MAVARQKLRFDKTRRKSGKTTKTKRGKGPSGEETAPLDGAECLRQAVDRRLGWNSEMLADILEAKALNGDLATTKVMVVLADGKKPEPVMKRHGLSIIEQWAREPQWEGPPDGEEEEGGGEVEAER